MCSFSSYRLEVCGRKRGHKTFINNFCTTFFLNVKVQPFENNKITLHKEILLPYLYWIEAFEDKTFTLKIKP